MFVKCVYFFVNKRVYLKFGGDSMKMISSAVENGSSTWKDVFVLSKSINEEVDELNDNVLWKTKKILLWEKAKKIKDFG